MADDTAQLDSDNQERGARIAYSLLLPVARIARHYNLPLKDLIKWLKLAYFQELRRDGLTLKDTAVAMDISMPTAARLSKSLKTNFYAPEREHELPQQIEFALGGGPLSRARLRQVLTADNSDIDSALDQMVEEGRLERNGQTYKVVRHEARLVKSGWTQRIGSLNSLLDNLSHTVIQRLIEERASAFARTLNFRIRPEDLSALKELYEEKIWPRLVELDEKAQKAGDAQNVKLSLFWAKQEKK